MKKALEHVTQGSFGRLAVAIALIACQARLQAADGQVAAGSGLRLLPENPRYFEYKGLPLVLFGHQGGQDGQDGHQGGLAFLQSPSPATIAAVRRASRYSNHCYMPAFPTWVRATYEEIHAQLDDGAHWQRVRDVARMAWEHDVILHLFFWSYKFNIAEQDWSGSDMIWADPDDDGGVVLPSAGLTRRGLHELAIKRMVAATWDLPNVVYNFMWEYNVRRRGKDPQGAFHRWWAATLREEGARIDSRTGHLISIKLGSTQPQHSGADFVVEEDGNGFWYNHPHRQVLEHRVPAVFISSDFAFADNQFRGWEHVPHSPRVWSNGQVRDYRITPQDARAMATEGFHPAESWSPANDETLHYYLQARWYLENVGILSSDPNGRLNEMPHYRASQRPSLENPDGFTHGRRGDRYAAVYRHPDGLAPAQAEVWIDVNGDGRFSPDPAAGERFAMAASGTDYRKGALFTVTGPADRPWVFRFSDVNWNPPVRGGLVAGNIDGISYDHWSPAGGAAGAPDGRGNRAHFGEMNSTSWYTEGESPKGHSAKNLPKTTALSPPGDSG